MNWDQLKDLVKDRLHGQEIVSVKADEQSWRFIFKSADHVAIVPFNQMPGFDKVLELSLQKGMVMAQRKADGTWERKEK